MKIIPRFTPLSRLILVGSAALLLAPSLNAGTLTWKGNNSTDLAGANWGTAGTSLLAAGDSMTFGVAGTSGTALTNTGSLSIALITFNAGASSYTLSGNSIALTSNITNYSAVTQTINNNLVLSAANMRFQATAGLGDLVLGGNLSGANGFSAYSSGTIVLNGTNTFSGAISLNSNVRGLVVINGDSSAVGGAVLTNGRLTLSGSGKLGGSILAGNTSLLTVDNSGVNLSNRLNTATYRAQGGTFNFIGGAGGSIETLVRLSIDDGTDTRINLTASTTGQTVLAFQDVTKAGVGVSVMVKGDNLGAARGANNTNMVINTSSAGFLTLGGGGAAGTQTISIHPNFVGQDTAKSGNDQYGFMTAYAGGVLDTTNGLRNLTASEYADTITNNATVLNNVSLTSAASDLAGTSTKINALRLDDGGSVSIGGTLAINSGGILALNGNQGISGGTLLTDGGKSFIITTIGDLTVDSVFAASSGNTGITKAGDGTLTLAGQSIYTGTNYLGAGTTKLSGAATLGAATNGLVVNNLALLDLNGASLGTGTLVSTSASGSATITNNGTGTSVLTVGNNVASGGSNFFARILDSTEGEGKIAIVKNGNGLQNFGGANTYSGGTTVNSGTLQANVTTAFGASTGTMTVNGGVLDVFAKNINIGALNGTGGTVTSTSGTCTLTLGNGDASGNYAGSIGNTAARSLGLTKVGTGSQVLAGTATYSGTTTISAGTLQFGKKASLYNGGATASWSSANIKVANGATLAVNVGGDNEFAESDVTTLLGIGGSATTGFQAGSNIGFDTTNAVGGNFNYTSAIGNSYLNSNLGLTKLGTNTLTLTEANTYTGATKVSAGTLKVNGSLAAASAVNVAIGGTLGGTGTISGATTVNGTLAPGNSIGTISTGDLTLEATSILDVELGRDGLVAISDRTDVTGAVNIISGAQLKLTVFDGLTSPLMGDMFFLISNDSTEDTVGSFTFTDSFAVTTTLTEGSQFTWNNLDWEITYKADADQLNFVNGNDVAIMVVPEPSTWALLTGGVGMLIAMQGARRRSRVS